jgi:release factor glutamine methyltransferase
MKINFQQALDKVLPHQPDLNLFQFEKYWNWYLEIHHHHLTYQSKLDVLFNWISECKTGKPLGHILGQWAFFQDIFFVDNSTLIPRPETEILVEIALKKIQKPSQVLEIGVGTGAVILSVMLHAKHPLSCLATDISSRALSLCQKNFEAKKHRLQQHTLNFLKTDRTQHIEKNYYDVILCNPPYIPENHPGVSEQVKLYEPASALFLPEKEYMTWMFYLIKGIYDCLNTTGFAIIEGHEDYLKKIEQSLPQEISCTFSKIEIIKDLNQYDRFLYLKK